MAIRISCPSCDAALSFDDEKRGKKVRCKKCEESFTLNASNGKAKTTETAVQNAQKTKVKAAAKTDDVEVDDERPAKKKSKPEPKKGGKGIFLILGGVGAVLLLCLGLIGGGAALLLLRKPVEVPIALSTPDDTRKATEEKKEPEPKKDAEPKKDLEPKKDPEPKTGGPPLSPELQRVKQATVFLSSQLPTGATLEGSGFLAVEDGVVVTNAHVIGMQNPNTPAPTRIDVTLYPGEPNQAVVPGTLLGVDRTLDLAAIRVTAPNLPARLNLEDSARVAESQQVQVASYPRDGQKRIGFTLTPTAIAKLKKAPTGKLDEVQVGGGIARANSGGPVVTLTGMVVGIAGNDEQTKRATAGDSIKRFLDGGIGAAAIGKVMPAGKDQKVSVTYQLNDPLGRIKEARVEVWSGNPGLDRPYSYTPPAPLAGDGAHQPRPIGLQKTSAGGDVVLPAPLLPGKVVWLQPVILLRDNTAQWGIATSLAPPPPSSPYDLRPANLTVKFPNPKDRTAKVDATFRVVASKKTATTRVQVDVLERIATDMNKIHMKAAFGSLNITSDADGPNQPVAKQTLDLVRQSGTTYTVDGTNKVVTRNFYQFDLKLPKEIKDPALKYQFKVLTAHDSGILPMPNRTVQPMESFPINTSMTLYNKGKVHIPNVTLTGTYQGFQTRSNRTEAIITVTGKLESFDPDFKLFDSKVTGTIGFDDSAGYISSSQLKFTNAPDSGDKDSFRLDVNIQRYTGNLGNIQFAQDTKPADPKNGKPTVVVDAPKVMTVSGLFDPQFSIPKQKRIAYRQDYPLQMEQGKNYTIHVTNAQFDSYIKVLTVGGQVVAQAGGAGNSSKVTYRATMNGQFVVSIISHNGKIGNYHLKIEAAP